MRQDLSHPLSHRLKQSDPFSRNAAKNISDARLPIEVVGSVQYGTFDQHRRKALSPLVVVVESYLRIPSVCSYSVVDWSTLRK